MQKLLKGNIAQKIILVLIIAILCNFIVPNYSHADANDVAGVLGGPIRLFLTFVGDCAVTVIHKFMLGEFIGAAWADAKPDDSQKDNWNKNIQGEIAWPTILISPEEIITGKVSILNANFIKGSSNADADGDGVKGDDSNNFAEVSRLTIDQYRNAIKSGKKISTSDAEEGIAGLRTTISQWYNLLRNISAAALFCVLIYMGIRMVLSSVSDEKAKYKKMMTDWIAAICILFFVHYIMAVIMYASEKIVDVIGNGLSDSEYEVVIDSQNQNFTMTKTARGTAVNQGVKPKNLMELVRVYISAHDATIAFSYLLMYFALIAVSFMFIYKYLKRFMTMALLTLIAPLIAVTYPIDRVKDGQAQAFSMWLREYIFNALMQPIHLLIYMVLVGSAMDLVKSNIIYAIVAMLSILPAEKLIKSMFGFDKTSTTDGIGDFAKGAVLAKAASALAKGGKSSAKLSSGTSKIRQTNNKPDSGKDSIGIGDAYGSSEGNQGLGEGDNDNINMANMPVATDEPNDNSLSTGILVSPKKSTEKADVSSNNSSNTDNHVSSQQVTEQSDKSSNNSSNTSNSREQQQITAGKSYKNAEKKQKRSLKRPKVIKGVGNVIGTGFKYVNKNKGTILKAGLKGAGGLAGAAFGAGAAIVTGDISHIATGAAAGLGVGAGVVAGVVAAGSGIANAGRGIRTAYREGALGEDATEKLERYKAYKKDEENIEAFQKEFKNPDGSRLSRRQAKDKIEEARDFIEAGYTDAKEIKKLMKMRDIDANTTSTQVMAAHQQAEKYGVDYFMDEKKRSTLEESVTNKIMMDAGISDAEKARGMAQKHIDLMAMSKGMPTIYSNSKQPGRTKVDVKDSVKRKTEPNQTVARKEALNKHFKNNTKSK